MGFGGELPILDEEQHLWGTLDRSDIFRLSARVTVTPTHEREALFRHNLAGCVQRKPPTVALNDSTAVSIRDYARLEHYWLSVVQSEDEPRPVDNVGGERIANHVVRKIA